MKTILLIFIFFNLSFASLLKNVYIVKDNPSITFENISLNSNFKKATKHIQRNTKNQYWVKIEIDKSKFIDDTNYIFRANSRFSTNQVIYPKHVKKNYLDSNTIDIDINTPQYLYLKIINQVEYVDVQFSIENQQEFYDKINNLKTLFGVTYGIIFSAFLYYLAFYIFNRQKSFIYYSLTQVSLLFMLLDQETDSSNSIFAFLIFSNLFTKEFLNTKKYTPKLNNMLNFIIIFYLFDFVSNGLLGDFFPSSILLLFYIFAAISVYTITKLKPILFYIAGWSIIIFSFVFIDFQFFFADIFKTEIPFDIFIHIIAPMESLILAFALSYKIKILEEQNIEKERLLIHQNKLVAMGEMISNIAHQWRQPLSHLSYLFMNINTAFKHEKLDSKYLENKTNEANIQLSYMSNTIDDFKDFYSPQKEKKVFSIKEEIIRTNNIVSSTLKASQIELITTGEDFSVHGYESEFSQVLLNLITNAKDALIDQSINSPKITLTLNKKNKVLSIEDNAKGIDRKIKERIFEPYFTTKTNGGGIGLYMSKTIIEKHFNAKLLHHNTQLGSCFSIQF